jgi:hypothetical protein
MNNKIIVEEETQKEFFKLLFDYFAFGHAE